MALVFIAAFLLSLAIVAVAFALGAKSWALLAMPGVLALAPFAFRNPQAILLGMIALIPLDVFAVLPGQTAAALTFTKLLFPAATAILFLRYLVSYDRRVSLHAIDRWLLIWAIYSALGVLIAVDRPTALNDFRRSLSMWLFYLVLSRSFVEAVWQKRLLATVRITVGISVAIGIGTYLTGNNPFSTMSSEGDVSDSITRITGASSISPNLFATFLLLPLSVSLFAIVGRRGRARFWGFVGAGLMMTGLVLTFSRSAFLVMGTMLLLFTAMSWKKIHPAWFATALLLVVASLPAVPGRYWERMATLFAFDTSGQQDISLWRRTNYLRVGARILADHPVFGAGPGNFRVLHARAEYQQEVSLIGMERVAHNMYLTVVTEGGVVGAVIFGGFLFASLRSAWRLRRMTGEVGLHARAVLLALIGLLMLGMFQVMALNKYLWLMLATIRALSERSRRELAAITHAQQWAQYANAAAEDGHGSAPPPAIEPTPLESPGIGGGRAPGWAPSLRPGEH
ncbi:MAG: O-antigen ligase family protein [bacterium]